MLKWNAFGNMGKYLCEKADYGIVYLLRFKQWKIHGEESEDGCQNIKIYFWVIRLGNTSQNPRFYSIIISL